MLRQSFRISFSPESLSFQIIVTFLFSVIAGIIILNFSPIRALGILAAPILIFVMLKRPEIALLGILIATSSFIDESLLPMLTMGGISLHIPDLLLLGSLGLIIIRWLAEPEFKLVHTPLDLPLIIFYVVTLLASIIAILQSNLDIQTALRETRTLTYYLTFFIVTNLVRERRQLNLLVEGIIFLSTIVAVLIVAQYLLGDSAEVLPGYLGSLQSASSVFEGVSRIVPPGRSIVLVSFVSILCIMVSEKLKPQEWLKFLQFGLLGLALLFTFLRSYWAVLILVFILMLYLFRGADKKKLVGWSLVVALTAVMIFLPIFANIDSPVARLVGASVDRFNTLFNIGTFQGEDSSLNWRMIENGYAISTIESHPLLGLGMGFTYRPWDSRIDQPGGDFDFRKFIHNGHLWILLQSGFLGYFSLMWLSFAFLWRGFKYWRNIENDRLRAIMLGFTLVYVAVLISAFVNGTFMGWYWTPVIGIVMGVNEVILHSHNQPNVDTLSKQ